ncbi:hypothetical protein GCM10027275_12180 [Rhabdobacter roseus]|uniref:STAS/SEC14 domain-containing protein n=1 Tax=Rhabdobacter roseus TaxID=1655419 RepID=A0A840TPI2_9BACT|nr:STAS/SEC14 domain-containing protein [Rhabdobacter roseus]MBB5283133.1 hypothetical protein [Rhabdobacter roseus]
MFSKIQTTPENVLGVLVTGKITKADYDYLNPLLEAHKQKYGDLRLYVELHDFQWPDAPALWEDLKMTIKYLGPTTKLAITTETDWIEKIAEGAGAVIPGMEVKAFHLPEREQALVWASA